MDSTKKAQKLPGPIRWPIVGSMFYLTSFKERVFMDWIKHYGNIYQAKVGSKDFVVVNGYEAVKAVLMDAEEVYSSRDEKNPIQAFKKPGQGLFFCPYNDIHKKLKPFMIESLSKIKTHTDKAVKTEITKMISHLNKLTNKPVDIQHVIRSTMANVLLQTFYSKSFEYGNSELETVMNLCEIGGNGEADKGISKMLLFDWIVHFPSIKRVINTKRNNHNQVKKIFNNFHEQRLAGSDECRPNQKSGTNCSACAKIPFFAGTQTTKCEVSWILLELLRSVEPLQKVEEEIKTVFKGNKDYFDKDLYSELHYCKAVVEEGLRLRPIAPTVSPHFSIQNSTLQGYHIPKDVNIFCNVWSVHRDPKFWSPDPDSFRPERHLDENGRFTPTGRVMTFSLGRRFQIGQAGYYDVTG